MDISEFVLNIRQESVERLTTVVFGFYAYLIAGVGGLMYIYKDGETSTAENKCSRCKIHFFLLLAILAGVATASLLRGKYVERRDFCTNWLSEQLVDNTSPEADSKLIKIFCDHYNKFIKSGGGYQKGIFTVLNFVLPPLSAVFYTIALSIIAVSRSKKL